MSEEGKTPSVEELESRVAELEALADSLGSVPDEEVVEALGRAIELLQEINAGIEKSLRSARQEERDAGEILEDVDFGPLDEALEEIQNRKEPSGEGER